MNKDQAKGQIETAKDKTKEINGKILGDKVMEADGNVKKNVGKLQDDIGNLKEKTKKGYC